MSENQTSNEFRDDMEVIHISGKDSGPNQASQTRRKQDLEQVFKASKLNVASLIVAAVILIISVLLCIMVFHTSILFTIAVLGLNIGLAFCFAQSNRILIFAVPAVQLVAAIISQALIPGIFGIICYFFYVFAFYLRGVQNE